MKKLNVLLAVAALSLILAGCSQPNEDLRTWMAQQGQGQRGKIPPLPTYQEYQPFEYNDYALQDPFYPRKMGAEAAKNPNEGRPPQPLEAYPLESLSMVGTIQKGNNMYALIRVPNHEIYQVGIGNYVGQNYGKIISISETEVQLSELVQDGQGDWTDRPNSLKLVESDSK
jgi:type IV pilus assembly protein PilP